MEHPVKPILTEAEREERHQEFLRTVDRILKKYKSNESQSEKSLVSNLEETSTQQEH